LSDLRILWLSNSPTTPSGFGKVTRESCLRLIDRGYDVICAGNQLQAGKFLYEGKLLVVGRYKDNFFRDILKPLVEYYDRNLIITMMSIWALNFHQTHPNYAKRWLPITPVEGELSESSTAILDPARACLAPVAISDFGYRELRKFVDRVYLYYHGVDPEVFFPLPEEERRKARWELGVREDDFGICFCGLNLYERKDFPKLFKVLATFFERVPRARKDTWLYIHTNTAPEPVTSLPLLEIAQKYGISDRVKVPKYHPDVIQFSDEQLCRIYNCFDIYMSCSRAEGFGLPILEAAACGIPVIAPDNTTHPELVSEHGWLVKCSDTSIPLYTGEHPEFKHIDLEDAVEKLEYAYFHREELKERGKRAREFALRYDWDKLIDRQLIPILEEIAPMLEYNEGVDPLFLKLIPKKIFPERVLDLGCGLTQPYKPHLSKLGEYVGFDLRGGRGIVQGDAHHLPFRDKEFGLVWCVNLLEHVEDPQRVLDEAKRVGVSGVVIFPTPLSGDFSRDPSHRLVDIEAPIDSEGRAMILW